MIKHVLADGRQVDSIAGRVIGLKEFKELYNIINAINERTVKDGVIQLSEKRA